MPIDLDIHMGTICEVELYYILALLMYFKIYCFKNLSLNIQLVSLWILPTFLPFFSVEGCSLSILKRLQSGVESKMAKNHYFCVLIMWNID